MHNDLISRSALLEKLNDTGVQITFDLPVEEILGEDVDIEYFAMLVQDAVQVYRKMIIGMIDEQPTAYDVEKVVEQLEKKAEEHRNIAFDMEAKGFSGIADKQYAKQIACQNAIEIVRNGGKE